MRCCVPFCQSSREDASPSATTTKQIVFYAFPSSRSELASWLRALGMRGSMPVDAAVCSRHFLPEDMCGDGVLRAGAVPTTVQVCMICLDTDCKMFSMGNYDLKEGYEHLTSHPLFDAGNLKHVLCLECAQQLSHFEKFRDKSLRARALMMDLVKQHGVITIQHITALQLLRTTIDALAEDNASAHEEDSAGAYTEVKKEPDVHMAWDSSEAQAEERTVAHTEENSDTQAVDGVDAQALNSSDAQTEDSVGAYAEDGASAHADVKKEPNVHMV